jgi:M6 family metalloprotease-like protein
MPVVDEPLAPSRIAGGLTATLVVVIAIVCSWQPPVGATPQAGQAGPAFEGYLEIVWGDPHPVLGRGGEVRYSLGTVDGRHLALQLPAELQQEALGLYGQLVTVVGQLVPGLALAPGAAPGGTIVVSGLTPRAGPAAPGAGTYAVTGTRKVIFLLVRYSNDPSSPHVPSFYANLTNPLTPPGGAPFPSTINGFYTKTSNSTFSWNAAVGGVGGLGAPGGWLTLPRPKTYYANCGWGESCAQLSQLAADAMALGRAQGIDFSVFDNINFVINNDLDCCAWGGGYYDSVTAKGYGATWEPPWGQETGTYVHEMGHSIGLPHSGWVYYAYDSPWDMMSSVRTASSQPCGSYISINSGASRVVSCSEPGDGFIMQARDYLGWLPAGNITTVTLPGAATVTLEAGGLPVGSATKYIKICLAGQPCSGASGSSAHFFTVEARVKGLGGASQYDNGIPGEGVIIHDVLMNRRGIGSFSACFFNTQSGWSVPIDATPGDYSSTTCAGTAAYPNYALFNAQWTAGRTYANSTYRFRVAVNSRSESTFSVTVDSDTPIYTDDPLTVGRTIVKAVHVTELRMAIETLRARNRLGAYTWTDGTLTVGGTSVKALHIGELRAALNEVYAAASRKWPTYTDPTLTATSTAVKAVHITELRNAINAIW